MWRTVLDIFDELVRRLLCVVFLFRWSSELWKTYSARCLRGHGIVDRVGLSN